MTSYIRKDYAGGAADTTISAGITSGDLTISIASSTGWPSGSNGPFYAVLDYATDATPNSLEEKILVTSRSGTTLTVSARGVDGTTAAAHTSGAKIRCTISAVDFDEANYAVVQTVGKVAAAGDMLVGSAANTLAKVAKGSNSTVWQMSSGGVQQWATIAAGMFAASAVATADIANNAVTLAKLATQADQTILGNVSGGAAVPVALTATQVKSILASMPRGYVTSASVTAQQTCTGGAGVLTDLTSLTVTFTGDGVRRYRITGFVPGLNNGGLWLRESSTVLAKVYVDDNNDVHGILSYVVVASNASHTYKLTCEAATASAPVLQADTIAPAYIMVEDIGI